MYDLSASPFSRCSWNAEEQDQEEEEEVDDDDSASIISQPTERARLDNLWENNPRFRNDLKRYIKATSAIYKPRTRFLEKIRAVKQELQPTYLPLKLQLEGLYNVKRDELMSSDECKQYKSALSRARRLCSSLVGKYNLGYAAYEYLKQKEDVNG